MQVMHGKLKKGTHCWSHQSSTKMSQPLTRFSEERRFRRRGWSRGREGMRRWIEKQPEAQHLEPELPDKPFAWWSCTFFTFSSGTGANLQPFWIQVPQNPNKYNSLSNLKRKQRNLSILACQRLIYHLSQALPNLLSQFHFFSRLKDELLQETIKQWTGSALKLVLSNSKEIANTLGQRAKYFQHFPRKINYFTSELQEVSTGSPRF